jgi:hypothetical protein
MPSHFGSSLFSAEYPVKRLDGRLAAFCVKSATCDSLRLLAITCDYRRQNRHFWRLVATCDQARLAAISRDSRRENSPLTPLRARLRQGFRLRQATADRSAFVETSAFVKTSADKTADRMAGEMAGQGRDALTLPSPTRCARAQAGRVRWERVAVRPGEGHCRWGPSFPATFQRTGARAPHKAHITTLCWDCNIKSEIYSLADPCTGDNGPNAPWSVF